MSIIRGTKIDFNSPDFTGDISIGRKNGTSVGNRSFAQWNDVEASGDFSTAQGNMTVASNFNSHAEGFETQANGASSHAEGIKTQANGIASHSEGIGTIASQDYQTVSGKYNVEDIDNQYVHIVGNGISNTTRSNAHTLDWNGNAWYQGDIYTGGRNQLQGNKVLTTADISFNESGELVVTINGVTKTFVPKN